MSWLSNLFQGKQKPVASGGEFTEPKEQMGRNVLRPKFEKHAGTDVSFNHMEPRHQGSVQYYYEIYRAKDKRAAMRFLARVPQADIEPRYYVVVETPEGEFGKDIDGIYQDDNV